MFMSQDPLSLFFVRCVHVFLPLGRDENAPTKRKIMELKQRWSEKKMLQTGGGNHWLIIFITFLCLYPSLSLSRP